MWNKNNHFMVLDSLCYAGSFQQDSDQTMKKNIKALQKKPVIEFVRKLRPVSFDWKESGDPSFGFIAQHTKKVAEEVGLELPVVHKNSIKKKYSLPYSLYTAFLTVAVQDIYKRLEKLEEVKV